MELSLSYAGKLGLTGLSRDTFAWFEVTGGVTFFSPQFDKPELSEVVRLLDTVNLFDEVPAGAAEAAMEM